MYKEITTREVGKAFKVVRQKFCPQTQTNAAAKAGIGARNLGNRESGDVALKVDELINYARAWDVSPVAMFEALLRAVDSNNWEALADKLGVSPAVARHRFKAAKAQYQVSDWQLWLLIDSEQVEI